MRLSSRACPFYGVVTSFTLEQVPNAAGTDYSRAVVKSVGLLTPDEAGRFRAIGEALDSKLSSVRVADVIGE